MYIEKRWLLPALLGVMFLAGLAVVVALALRPVQTRTVQLTSAAVPATQANCAPAPAPVQAAAPVASRDTQINTGGFGDIGMQFQNVSVNAPITNVHIANNGNNNSNNINVGNGNTISDPPGPASTPPAAATPPAASTPPTVTTPVITSPTPPSTAPPTTPPTTPGSTSSTTSGAAPGPT